MWKQWNYGRSICTYAARKQVKKEKLFAQFLPVPNVPMRAIFVEQTFVRSNEEICELAAFHKIGLLTQGS